MVSNQQFLAIKMQLQSIWSEILLIWSIWMLEKTRIRQIQHSSSSMLQQENKNGSLWNISESRQRPKLARKDPQSRQTKFLNTAGKSVKWPMQMFMAKVWSVMTSLTSNSSEFTAKTSSFKPKISVSQAVKWPTLSSEERDLRVEQPSKKIK